MTGYVDKDLLLAYLDETLKTFAEIQGHVDPGAAPGGNDRVNGAILALKQVQAEVTGGRFAPARVDPDAIVHIPRTKVRRKDPDTSWAAATQQSPQKSRLLYEAIQILLSREPMTDEEMIVALRRSNFPHTPSGVRTRRKELMNAGWVQDSGQRRATEAGSPSIVWRWTEDAGQ